MRKRPPIRASPLGLVEGALSTAALRVAPAFPHPLPLPTTPSTLHLHPPLPTNVPSADLPSCQSLLLFRAASPATPQSGQLAHRTCSEVAPQASPVASPTAPASRFAWTSNSVARPRSLFYCLIAPAAGLQRSSGRVHRTRQRLPLTLRPNVQLSQT